MEPSTTTPPRSGFESQATVSSFLTSIVLLVGVSGGLFIVITVIVICKYCQGKGKSIKREGFRGSGLENVSERTYCALHRYETINSDVFSDPSSCSIDGAPLTPRKPLDFRVPEFTQESEEPTETTKLKNDYEQPDYALQDAKPTATTDVYMDSVVAFNDQEDMPTTTGSAVGSGYGSRRVSFQLSNLPRSSSSGDFKLRRYIEGDYHHLKHTKIGRSIPRQFSMGGAGSAVPGRILLDDPQFRFSSLDERLTNASTSHHHPQFTIISHHGLSQNDPILRSLRDLQMHSSATQLHIGNNQQQQQQQQPFPISPQQQQQQQLPRDQRRQTFNKDASPRHSRDTLVIDSVFVQQRSSNDKLNSPSPTYNKSPRMLKKSPSPTFNYVWDGSKLSPSPPNARSIRESRSTSPLALSPRDGSNTAESPPSPFMPIKEFNHYGGTPSPPHKPTKTQVAVEIHQQQLQQQQQQQYNTDASGNSSTNSEEIHQQLQIRLDRTRSCTGHISPSRSNVPLCRTKCLQNAVYSSSLESASTTTQRSSYGDSRKVKSYDDYKEDYDVLKITEFSRGPFHSTDYEVMAELGSPTASKVRYNDTGSLEQLHEEDVVSLCGADYNNQPSGSGEIKQNETGGEGSSDGNSGSVTGNRKYRALWRLRATLEEEEECSDTIRMEDMTSPDDSPDREHATTPNTTSFESNALSDPCPSDHRDSGVQFEPSSTKIPNNNRANLLHPNYENRRQNYRNVMNNMLQRRNQSTSVENSFDSVETDGDVSDTSRYEVTTTSFESTTTTDNTDSTTESQASRLKQMKADSGYKSLEAQQQGSKELTDSKSGSSGSSSNGHAHYPLDPRKEILRVSLERKEDFGKHNHANIGLCSSNSSNTNNVEPILVACSPSRDRQTGNFIGNGGTPKHGCVRKSPPNTSHFDRRNGKTASKKRREYSRERQIPLVNESMIHEPETDSRSDLHSGDSFEDNTALPNKASLFTRFFKSHSRGHKTQYLVRDYSIDEKTNSIFNEFVRQDNSPSSSSRDHTGRLGVRRSPRMHRHRFQRKHTEPAFLNEDRLAMRNRLAPGMRSASLGSDSSASSARRISPQDSIEEEDDEVEEAMDNASGFSYSLDGRHPSFGRPAQGRRDQSIIKCQLQSMGIHDIPIIKLPEEECHDSH